jgi:hypothetical protein
MFRTTIPAVEPDRAEAVAPPDLVPLSVLSLDLPAPVEGWTAYLNAKDIEVVDDDLGRSAVTRSDAKRLFDEAREAEERKAQRRKLAEAQAVADDQIRRAQIWRGVPADHMPPDIAPAAVMLQASRDARPKRTSVLQEALAGSETLTYHPLPTSDEDAS